MKTLIIALTVILGFGSFASDKPDLFPETMTYQGKTLKLSGVALRKVFLGIKVYRAGFYMETKETDSTKVLGSDQIRAIKMHFLRDAGVDRIKDAMAKGIKKNCDLACDSFEEEKKTFVDSIVPVKEGDEYFYYFTKDGFEYKWGDRPAVTVKNKNFARAVLATWIGKEPPSKKFKNDLLGIKK